MELGLSIGNVIDSLKAHNAGGAQKVVQSFKVAGIPMSRNAFKLSRSSCK